ncbi:hypothetical protein CTEN210_04801 [Chaetoceros tenuissimus]|uniref:MYND-type domain-containing protein n=1 Tax=Chaetoceros tenuissimus TaxID=426638 RepID=A0AAD3CNI5_9STRA|nr:hypothetical protein CTEN210_04801 [Chaetoceros tenuissimus]
MSSTTTTTTKKPIGPCAACNKEGAVLRCVPCRDAGVDVFFCDRECQVKLWKTHKLVCKKTSNGDLPTASKETKAEGEEGLRLYEESSACTNCMKTHADIGSKLSVCSKCKSAYYCSRECQVKDWPKHKRMCKHYCEVTKSMERSLDSREKDIHNLFQTWLSKTMTTNFFSNVVYLAFKKKDIEQQPPRKAVLVEVEFDYNAQTFVAAEVPRAVAIDDLDQESKESVKRILKERTVVAGGIDQRYNHFVFLSIKEFGKKFPFYYAGIGITRNALDRMNANHMDIGMPKLRNVCAHVCLKSHLFRGWKSIRRNNLQKLMEQMKLGQSCNVFVQNALQFFCNKSLQNTHRVIVYMNMGTEIGQISQFDEYGIVSFIELKNFKEDNEKIFIHVEDTESRPSFMYRNGNEDFVCRLRDMFWV